MENTLKLNKTVRDILTRYEAQPCLLFDEEQCLAKRKVDLAKYKKDSENLTLVKMSKISCYLADIAKIDEWLNNHGYEYFEQFIMQAARKCKDPNKIKRIYGGYETYLDARSIISIICSSGQEVVSNSFIKDVVNLYKFILEYDELEDINKCDFSLLTRVYEGE